MCGYRSMVLVFNYFGSNNSVFECDFDLRLLVVVDLGRI